MVELPSQVLVVDAQYLLPYAREVARGAAALGKPLTRLYVTHYHPDHLLGAGEFSAPLHALPAVADKIAAAGNRVAAEEHEKAPALIADRARAVDARHQRGRGNPRRRARAVSPRGRCGKQRTRLPSPSPDEGIIIVQDLVYHRAHAFVGERRFDTWRAALRYHRTLPARRGRAL